MLRGRPPPPTSLFFFFFLPLFLHFSKKSENFGGGGLNPLNPPPLNTPLDIMYQLINYRMLFTSLNLLNQIVQTSYFPTILLTALCDFFTLISLLFTSMLSHGVAPTGLLLSTIWYLCLKINGVVRVILTIIELLL